MKISKNWLKEYLDLSNITDEELHAKINAHVCEIETYKKLVEATNLTIGYVHDCVMHPDSDHLHICQVEVEPGVIKQIVCGAPNVDKGQKVIVANVGAVLPGDFKIKAAKVRGVESNGMLCSLQELGIEEKYIDEEFKHGIQLLGEDAEIGACPLEYLGLDDTVIDLDVTSNRSDLLSIEGAAFDIGAALDQPVYTIIPELEEVEEENTVTVDVQTEGCYKYLTRVIKNVTIQPSPQWLKAKLIASGVRPINNVVDITNYVLFEMGQPLHAFDKDRLGNHIIVRDAVEGEKLVTLDEIERTLTFTDVVIANETEALCLGGVMGGLSSEVENDTKNVLLEAAYFDPLRVRKTSSRLGLKSESSTRFERKIDYERVERALDYAAQLIAELGEGEVLKGVTGVITKVLPTQTVDITVNKINGVLGTSLSKEEVEHIFDRLAYNYKLNGDVYTIVLPSRRMDLEASYQDIIEDVARMNGYDNIPTTIASISSKGGLTYKQSRSRQTKLFFSNMGLNEVVTYSMIAEKDLYAYTLTEKDPIKVLMPMTEDKAVMRQSLLNGVVDAIAYNKARKVENLSIFEIGNTYSTESEVLKLAGAMNGVFESLLWKGSKQVADFYVLKGVLDAYFERMGANVTYKAYSELENLHPGRTAGIYLGEKMIGYIGELHPRFAKKQGVNGTVVFEIELDDVLSLNNSFKYKPLNKFPSVTRDLAIVVKKDITCEEVLSIVRQTTRKNLVNLEVFDLYTGENVAEDEKSIAIKLTLEDASKTLESTDVDKIIKSVVNRLQFNFQAKLRD